MGYRSIAFPLIGAGTGGASQEKTLNVIYDEIERSNYKGDVVVVKFGKKPLPPSNILLEMERDKHETELKESETHDYPEFIPPTTRQELYRRLEKIASQPERAVVIFKSHEAFEDELLDDLLEQAYEGEDHSSIHEELLHFIQTANHHFLRHLLSMFDKKEFDVLVLKIHALAAAMKMVGWDGLSFMYDFPKFTEPEYRLLCETIGEDMFMASQQMPQSNIDRLDTLLRSDDRQVIIATLVYLHAWLTSGGPKDLRLKHIRPILQKFANGSDELLKAHTKLVYDFLSYLAKKYPENK